MKKKISEQIEIPAGISCEAKAKFLNCRKDSAELSKAFDAPSINVRVAEGKIVFECEAGNKSKYKIIKSYIAHVKNIFHGLEKEYVYSLESCNVHFPMTLKVEGDKLTINNFLGEKTPRFAKILPGVKVEIKGSKITISGRNKEAAGQTSANFERATKIRNRDRRVFQDGIFITERPGGAR
jgi:large subunit ribosomal protein L6